MPFSRAFSQPNVEETPTFLERDNIKYLPNVSKNQFLIAYTGLSLITSQTARSEQKNKRSVPSTCSLST